MANTGVWLSRKGAKSFIDSIKIDPSVAHGSRRWNAIGYNGEMPMILNALGVDVKAREIKAPTSELFGELHCRFHATLDDKRGMPKDSVFVHCLGLALDWVFSSIIACGIWDTQRYYREIHQADAPDSKPANITRSTGRRSCCG